MENIQKLFDVVVVGAGTAGTIAARFAAKKGLSVCLIDRKEKHQIGDKICGDAVGNEIFDFLNINHPKNEELSCYIKGAKIYSPNLKKCITLVDPKQAGYIINRLEFGQRLLNEALDAGVAQFGASPRFRHDAEASIFQGTVTQLGISARVHSDSVPVGVGWG